MPNWRNFFKKTAKIVVESEIPDSILESRGVPPGVIDFVEDRILGKLETSSEPVFLPKPKPNLSPPVSKTPSPETPNPAPPAEFQTPQITSLAEKSKEELIKIIQFHVEDLDWYVSERNRLLALTEKESTMSTPPLPLSTIFKFPYFSTREEAEKALGSIPVFDPQKSPKYWRDPNATSWPKKLMEYEPVLKITENGTIGRPAENSNIPAFDSIVITREDAAQVNIPDKGTTGKPRPATPEEARPEIPVPLDFSKIPSGYHIGFQFGGNVALIPDKVETGEGGGFTSEDRRVQGEILGKVNSLLETLKNI